MSESTLPATHNDAPPLSRRSLLKQSLAWSALAAAPMASHAAAFFDPQAAHALVLGDWGWSTEAASDASRNGTGNVAQTQVARGMQHYAHARNLRPDALFMLGDSWYGNLPGGAQSQRWVDGFERLYPSESFPGPVYSMLGNHDYQKLPPTVNKVEAELEYARTGRGLDGKPTRWTMPSRWYTFDFPQHQPLLRCIVLDSNMPAADGRLDHGANFTLTPDQQTEQLAWFEAELKKPRTTPFVAVLAHHPIWSNGPHGDHPILTRDWDPLMKKYGVDLYMAGHDHDLQHLEFEGHPTTHFLSGAGGADLYVLRVDALDRGPYAQEVHGFSHLTVTKSHLELRHLDADGRLLYGIRKGRDRKITVLGA